MIPKEDQDQPWERQEAEVGDVTEIRTFEKVNEERESEKYCWKLVKALRKACTLWPGFGRPG